MKFILNIKLDHNKENEMNQVFVTTCNLYEPFTVEMLQELREEIGVPNFPASKVSLRGGMKTGCSSAEIKLSQVWLDEFLCPEKDIEKLVANDHFIFGSTTEVVTDMETLRDNCEIKYIPYKDETTGEVTQVGVFYKFSLADFLTAWSVRGYTKEFSNYNS